MLAHILALLVLARSVPRIAEDLAVFASFLCILSTSLIVPLVDVLLLDCLVRGLLGHLRLLRLVLH